MSQNGHSAVEIFLERFLKARAPARHIGWQTVERESDGIEVEAGIDSTAAIESAPRIGVIEILDHTGHLHALEFVEGMLEGSEREAGEIHHKELADQSAGIRQPMRVEVRLRHQKQPRRLC